MARIKNQPNAVQNQGKKIWKVLQAKRDSQKSDSQDTVVDLTQEEISSEETPVPIRHPTARKSTGAAMKMINMSSSSDDEDDDDRTLSEISRQAGNREEARKVEYRAKDGTIKKRYAPGVRALKEIRFLQQSTDHSIPKLSFARLVREISQKLTANNFKYSVGSLMALHVSSDLKVNFTL